MAPNSKVMCDLQRSRDQKVTLNQLGLPNVYFQVYKLAVSQLVLWPATALAMFPVSLGHETHVRESISVEECTHMKGSIPECQPLHFRKKKSH